jgi:hypothetical protein
LCVAGIWPWCPGRCPRRRAGTNRYAQASGRGAAHVLGRGAHVDARRAAQVLDRGAQAVACGAAQVIARFAQTAARGTARCASQVFYVVSRPMPAAPRR